MVVPGSSPVPVAVPVGPALPVQAAVAVIPRLDRRDGASDALGGETYDVEPVGQTVVQDHGIPVVVVVAAAAAAVGKERDGGEVAVV